MPDDNSAIYAGASQAINSATNTIATSNTNKATRKWNEKQIAQQRKWAVDDRNMQNAYNHPSAQMARLREANLNPALMYGDSSAGGVAASSPRSVDSPSYKPETPDFSQAGGLSAYMSTKIQQAQLDNLRTQNTVLLNDAALKAASTAGKTVQTDTGIYQLDMLRRLQGDTLAQAGLKTTGMTIDNANKTILGKLQQQAIDIAGAGESRNKIRFEQEKKMFKQEFAQSVLNLGLTQAQTQQIMANIRNMDQDLLIKKLTEDATVSKAITDSASSYNNSLRSKSEADASSIHVERMRTGADKGLQNWFMQAYDQVIRELSR